MLLRPRYPNSDQVTRLREFYKACSQVLGAQSPFQEPFLDKLAGVLQARNKVATELFRSNSETMC